MCQGPWVTARPPASVTSSAPGSQSHGSVCGWIHPSRRPAATHASSSVPGPAGRTRPGRGGGDGGGGGERGGGGGADAGRGEPVAAEEGGDVRVVERAGFTELEG